MKAGEAFTYSFLNNELNLLYSSELNSGKKMTVFSILAIIIASPLSFYFVKIWLGNFACQVEISFLNFILAGFSALIISLLTVGFQTLLAALSNPVESLRSE